MSESSTLARAWAPKGEAVADALGWAAALSFGNLSLLAAAWPPARSLGVAVGFAVGGLGFGHVAARAFTWVVAAGLVGRTFQRAVGD